MDNVKKLIDAGSSIPTAIKEGLAQAGFATIAAFAAHHKLLRTTVTAHINGKINPTGATIAALIATLGGSELEWRELLWQAAKPSELGRSVVGL